MIDDEERAWLESLMPRVRIVVDSKALDEQQQAKAIV